MRATRRSMGVTHPFLIGGPRWRGHGQILYSWRRDLESAAVGPELLRDTVWKRHRLPTAPRNLGRCCWVRSAPSAIARRGQCDASLTISSRLIFQPNSSASNFRRSKR